MKGKKTVEQFIEKSEEHWQPILTQLREIILSTELQESMKWGMPVYTINGKNVVGLGAHKPYAGLWFYNGAFLKDNEQVLVNAQEGKTRGMRQWRFEKGEEVPVKLVLEYLEEAIQNQKEGKEIKPLKSKKQEIPEAFSMKLQENQALNANFNNLTPGKQREYLEYLNEAKQEKTVLNRIEKIIPIILEGKGLNDRYK